MRRHDLDLFSLLAGVLAVASAVVLGVAAYADLHVDGRIAWSAVLVGVGVVGLAAGGAAIRRNSLEPDELD